MLQRLSLFFIPLMFAVQAEQKNPKTILDGVYTADQAEKGQAEYERTCVKCHEGSGADGPLLMGRSFIDRWREDNLSVLFEFMKTRMPPDGTVTLSDSRYLQIVAYLLQQNGYPGGAQELNAESLASIRITGKDGPKPLPTNTLVQVVGCMTLTPDNAWMLTLASKPVRYRKGYETNAEELKKLASTQPGTQTFRLQNFTNIRVDFRPDAYKGHKLHITGALIRQSNNDRINVTALQSISPDCTQ